MCRAAYKLCIPPKLTFFVSVLANTSVLLIFRFLRWPAVDTPLDCTQAWPQGMLFRVPIVGLLIFACPAAVWAQERGEPLSILVNLLELPSSRATQALLQNPARIYWNQTPLRTGLREIGQQYRLTIWLDRDIDPNQLVTMQAAAQQTDASLQGRLQHIASLIGAEVGLIESVVYLGPVGRVSRLQRAAVELHDVLSRAGGSPNSATLRELRWGELATPAELVQIVSANWKISLEGELPHDLFHAGQFLQPTSLATQVTVLLGGFEREAEWGQGNRLRIVPLKPQSEWQGNYRKSDIDLRRLGGLKDQFAGAQCQTRGNISRVNGVTAFHLALLAPAPAANRPAVALGNKSELYEFEVANTAVANVLEHLGASLGFELEWDENCSPAQREQRISFKVKQVTLDQLLAEIARTSGLSIDRQATKVKVRAPAK